MKAKRLRIILGTISGIVFVYLIVSLFIVNNSRRVSYNYLNDYQSVSQYEQTIRVVADSDYPPFTYYDRDFYPTGHDIELIYAIAREMECNVDLIMTDWASAYSGMKDGSFDLLLSVNYSKERYNDGLAYSVPVLSDSYVFFGRSGDILSNTAWLSSEDLRIAALNNGSETETFLDPMGIGQQCTFYDSTHEAFNSVIEGENDLVVSNSAVGKAIIGLYGLPMNEKSGQLHETNYYILYRQENEELGARVNSAIEELRRSGTLSSLKKKWMDEYTPGLTFEHFLRNNSVVIFIMLTLTFMTVLIVALLIIHRMNLREKALIETDQLTGLYNLPSFYMRVKELLEAYPREKFVILFYNIDHFKVFNDVYGTYTTDRMLRNVGKKLKSKAGEKLICCHSTGDNFLLCRPVEDFSAKGSYEEFSALLSEVFPGYSFSVRLGYCPIEFGDDPTQICDRALLAQKSVKSEYNKHWAGYSPEMLKAIVEDNQVTGEVSGALENGNFIPYFQPQYDYTTGEIVGAEILMRWQHPERGLLLPLKFIPVLEKNGFIYELDKYAWRQACMYMHRWKEDGIPFPPLSVNVSRRDIYQDDLVDTLVSLVNEFELDPADLRLEITESGYIEDAQRLSATIRKLSELGFFIEMDDFGSGYSSLSILKDLPFNLVKLDMSLVQESGRSGKSGSILTSIVHLARQINVPVIAEGVETYSQAEFLKSIGCYYMQGYLFSHPVPFSEFDSLIRNSSCIADDVKASTQEFISDRFLTQDSQEALLFNNYVRGAYIAEYSNNHVEILRTNDKFFSALHIGREKWADVSSNLSAHFSPESRRIYIEMLTNAIVTAQEAQCELRCDEFADGESLWVQTKAKCIANRSGSYIFFCEVENVTGFHSLAAKNEDLLEELNTVVENVPIGVARLRCVKNGFVCEYANKVLLEMTGYSEEELYETADTDLFFCTECAGSCADCSSADSSFIYLRCRDGSCISSCCTGEFISDKRGKCLYAYFYEPAEKLETVKI